MQLAIININKLINTFEQPPSFVSGKQMAILPEVQNSFVLINNGIIVKYGQMEHLAADELNAGEVLDAAGRFVLPAWCDSHTHLVFAHSREHEFADKIRGLTYEEIASRGGGIINSVLSLRTMPEEILFEQAMVRANEVISYGTGAIEIKSGYGLSIEDEKKMLRVIRKLKERTPLTIKATFLGAHAVPPEFKGRQDDYVRFVIDSLLPEIAGEGLADYVDVFCDKGYFSVEQTERIIEAALKFSLKIKLHANELDFSGGVQLGVRYGAVSVDHLEMSGQDEIQALLKGTTMPTLLPNVSFYLGIPYAPARNMIDAGLPVALASDFNPGSAPSGNMQLVLSIACLRYGMMPEEAIHAATINGAKAMDVEHLHGTITVGKKASLIVTKKIPSLAYIPYAFGENIVERMILQGRIIR